ncbi:MAG: caspase family protein [Planctomycetaceae bacterium]|jgi:uncharacterized caspase-like protein|nr:caspase family protein [Planctomycetaceae bacterium]
MIDRLFFRTLVILSLVFALAILNTSIGYAGTCHVLLIGVNEYDNAKNEERAKEEKRPFFNLKNLSYCCADMISLRDALINSKFTNPENIVVLTSDAKNEKQKATITNINCKLKNIFACLKPDDTVFIAFAGHGLALPGYRGDEKSELYLCPMDAEIICNPKTGKFDCRQLLSRKSLEERLQECKASVKILVMDACRNRAVETRSIAKPELLEKPALNEISKIKEFISIPVEGLFQLFSCGDGETAAESTQKQHGIYSYFMIEGLKGAANSNGDGYLTLSELQQYVKENTRIHAKDVLNHDQTPKIIAMGGSTGEEVILVRCTPKPKEIASQDATSQTQQPQNSYRPSSSSSSSSKNKGGNSGTHRTR